MFVFIARGIMKKNKGIFIRLSTEDMQKIKFLRIKKGINVSQIFRNEIGRLYEREKKI